MRDRVLMDLARQLRACMSLETVFETAVKQGRQILACDRVTIWQCDQEQIVAVAESTTLPVSLLGERAENHFVNDEETNGDRQNSIWVIPNIHTAVIGDNRRGQWQQLHMQAGVILPLFCDHQLWGYFCATESQQPRDWQPDEIDWLEALSVHLEIALQQTNLRQQLQAETELRQQIETKLQKDELRAANWLSSAPVGIFCGNPSQMTTYVNEYCCRMLGVTPDTALGLNWYEVLHPDDRDRVIAAWQQFVDHQIPYQVECRIQRPDGSIAWVYAQAVAEQNSAEDVISYVGTLVDISDRKLSEQQFTVTEASSRAILTALPDLIVRVGSDGVYRECVTGYRMVDYIGPDRQRVGRSIDEMLSPAMAQNQKYYLQKALQTGELQVYEQQIQNRDSLQEEEVRIIKSGDDEALIIIRDITTQKLAEQALATQRDLSRLVVDITSRFVNLQTNAIDTEIEQALQRLGEFTKVDISYIIAFDPVNPAQGQNSNRTMSATHAWYSPDFPSSGRRPQKQPVEAFPAATRSLQEGGVVYVPCVAELSNEWAIDQANWQYFNLDAILAVPMVQNSVTVGFTGFACLNRSMTWQQEEIQLLQVFAQTISNIQERIRAEQQLKQSENKKQAILAAIPDLMFRLGADGIYRERVQRSSYEFCTFYPDINLEGQTVEAIVPPEIAERLRYSLNRVLQTNELYIYEQQVRFGDRIQDEEVRVVKSGEDEALFIVRDISDRKRAEREHLQVAAREQELKLLEQILDLVLAGYWDWDIPGGWEYLSPGFKRMFGYADDELPNMPESWKRLIFPEDLPIVLDCFERHVQSRGQVPYYNEVRYHHRDGSTVWVICSGQVVEWDAEGQPLRMIGCHVDITAHKQAESALLEAQQFIKSVLDTIPLSVFWKDRNLVYLGCNQTFLRWVGAASEIEVIGKSDFDFAKKTDDAESFRAVDREILDTETAQLTLEQWPQSDGLVQWLEVNKLPLRNAKGHVVGVLGIIEDISDRKRAEQSLTIKTEELDCFFSLALDLLCIGSIDGHFVRLNNQWEQTLDYPLTLLEGSHYLDWIHPDDIHSTAEVLTQLQQGQKIAGFANRFRCRDGSYRWLEWRSISSGSYLYSAARDFTERKQQEQIAAAELKDTQLLQTLSTQLITEKDIQAFYNEILTGAIALTRADAGSLQILDAGTQELIPLATQGLPPTVITLLHRVSAASSTPCGIALTTGERCFMDFDVLERDDPDGSLRLIFEAGYLSAQSTPLISRSGKQIGMISTHWHTHYRPSDRELRFLDLLTRQVADLIEQRQVDASLRESEEKFRQLAENIIESVFWIADPIQHRSLYVSPAYEQIWGCSRESLDSNPFDAMKIHPEDREQVQAKMQQDVLLGRYDEEFRIVRTDGEIRWIRDRGFPIRNADGQIYRAVGMAEDITSRKLAEAELLRANQELLRATRMKDEFLANMSHELRTPLNLILTVSESLQEGVYGDPTPRQHRALDTIQRSGAHLLELITDILDIAKIEAGEGTLSYAPTAIAPLCQASLAFVAEQAAKKNIQLENQIPSNLPNFSVDERRLRQVLINLLTNAVKFTPEGGCVTLEVSLPPLPDSPSFADSFTSSHLRFTVTDTGIGIPPEQMENLFKPFVQIDSALNRRYEGTGLGLALVKRIVELHQGRLEVVSEVGVGSCFTVELWCDCCDP